MDFKEIEKSLEQQRSLLSKRLEVSSDTQSMVEISKELRAVTELMLDRHSLIRHLSDTCSKS